MDRCVVALIVVAVFVVLALVLRKAPPPRDQSEHDPVWPDKQDFPPPSE